MENNKTLEAENIAIVGGGIAGLFCAHVLLQNQAKRRNVHLYEASERLGGRIMSIRLNKAHLKKEAKQEKWDPNLKCDGLDYKNLAFVAEFGPMRVELDKQVLLKALLRQLGISDDDDVPDDERDGPALTPFPSYASPGSTHDPQYELRPDEIGKTPLQLLKLALLRITLRIEIPEEVVKKEKPTTRKSAPPSRIEFSPPPSFITIRKELIEEITIAAATGQDVSPIFDRWLEKKLTSEHYFEISSKGRIDNAELCEYGFWNLLSDHLSHDAIAKIKDLGTFYHLLPENPNAAEWLVWWLIGFAIGNRLQGIFGGMSSIVDRLEGELKAKGLSAEKGISLNCEVLALKRDEETRKLRLRVKMHDGQETDSGLFDRVILALPKSPLTRIVLRSGDAFRAEAKDIDNLLDSAIAFPMVKTFVVVRNRWWESETMANRDATRLPTREVHYWAERHGGKRGLIMLYTDPPAASYWSNYLCPGAQTTVAHNAPSLETNYRLPKSQEERLKKKIARYFNEIGVADFSPSDILWYGIRDWGRQPYGGANHAWRPERKYWVVMARLADIGDNDEARIHICGEAYSDYHGFIEGSLRSSVYVLHRILDETIDENGVRKFDVENPWLRNALTMPEKRPGTDEEAQAHRSEAAYVRALQEWANVLNAAKAKMLDYLTCRPENLSPASTE